MHKSYELSADIQKLGCSSMDYPDSCKHYTSLPPLIFSYQSWHHPESFLSAVFIAPHLRFPLASLRSSSSFDLKPQTALVLSVVCIHTSIFLAHPAAIGYKIKKEMNVSTHRSVEEGFPTGTLFSGFIFWRGDEIRNSFQSPVVKGRQQMHQTAEGNMPQL